MISSLRDIRKTVGKTLLFTTTLLALFIIDTNFSTNASLPISTQVSLFPSQAKHSFITNTFHSNNVSPTPGITLSPFPTSTHFTETPTIPTITPTLELSPTEGIPDPPLFFIPLVYKQPFLEPNPIPPTVSQVLFCKYSNLNIPDDDPNGISDVIEVTDFRYITDIDIRVNVSHTWMGDLVIQLFHQPTGTNIVMMDRSGYPQTSDGCSGDDLIAIFDDELTNSIEGKCASILPSISGIYLPQEPLAKFINETISGKWMIKVTDLAKGDIGRLNDWCLYAEVSELLTTPTPTPFIEAVPESAMIDGVNGKPQAMPLDCESRSAVDWAAFYGVQVDEYEFFNNLPKSDNPDEGFVGNVFDRWGQIPPNSYGVHAEPVANLLRQYGLEAYAHRPLRWDQLRSEIASGNPVIVWVIGNVINGIPTYYQSSNGHITIVAKYEHTVIVTGYNAHQITYLNGSIQYTKNIDQFLDSWSSLGNMAITKHP